MKKYTAYNKIQAPYINLSEILVIPGLPILVVCTISYGIIYVLGLVPAIIANVIVSLFINFYYHGLKNAVPNGNMHIPSKRVPFIVVVLSMAPSFLVILGVLLTANLGGFLLVLYQKKAVFYPVWFALWCFVVFGLPLLYYWGIQLKYWFSIYYQAYCFTRIPMSIVHDPELLISIKEITFINRHKKRLSTVYLNDRKKVGDLALFNTLPISEKNELLYNPVFRNTIHIPKQSNVLQIRYYSVLEDCFYTGEIDFPYEQLEFVQNKYPLNESAFLRGMSTDHIILTIQQDGEVYLYNQYSTLVSPIRLSKEISSVEEHKKALDEYKYTTNDRNVASRIEILKVSNGIDKRIKLSKQKFNWQLAVNVSEKQEIMLKDLNNCFFKDEKIETDEVKSRYLPLYLEFTYGYYTWLLIHIDTEKLYDILSPLYLNDSETIVTFHITISIEEGDVSFVIKHNDQEVAFDGWQKELVDHRWDDAKNKYAKKKKQDEKQMLLNTIYELLQQKSYLKAQEVCKQAIEQQPDFAMLYFYEARLLWYLEGYEANYAQENYFIEKTKDDAYALARIYNHYGCLLDEEQRYEESLGYFEKAAITYPKEVIYTANIAEIYFKLKDAPKALHYANECTDKGYSSEMINEILKNKGVINPSYNKLKRVDDLLTELSYLAAQYRSAAENSKQHYDALEAYYTSFKELIMLNGGIMALDLDAELPDHLMPKEYIDYWSDSDKKENN